MPKAKPPSADDTWLPLGRASRLVGVDPDTLRRWADKGDVLEQLAEASEWGFGAYVPISALTSDGIDRVLDEATERLRVAEKASARIPDGRLTPVLRNLDSYLLDRVSQARA